MARNAGYSVENNFVNGLITEATGLNFPENAVSETDNCVFDEIGSVERRFGIDREPGYVSLSSTEINQAVSEYVWENVAGDGNRTFLVQQLGSTLYIFNPSGSGTISNTLIATLSLLAYATDLTQHPLSINQYASGVGKLIVTNPYSNPLYITYHPSSGLFDIASVDIRTRDLRGLDPHPVSRLPTITNTHLYNLINQGWDTGKINRMVSMGGVYPSDYDVWWLYKTPDALGTEVFLTDVAVSSGILNQVDRGNSPAPKGSIILNEFYQDRGGATGIGGIPVVTSGSNRPSSVAFHAGRAFYAGVSYQEFSSRVYFSQIIESDAQFGRCYQENDPTSQYTPDILPTDGGVIAIPEIGTIYRLWSIDNSLLVFGSAGVWQITGSSGIGFTATDYTVKKISSIKTLSGHSFVDANGIPLWWGLDGIYAAAVDGAAGNLVIQSITEKTIKTFYDEIPTQSKNLAKGAFNSKEGVIQWVYRSSEPSSIQEQYSYNRALNFNVNTKALYPWSFPDTGGVIKGVFSMEGTGVASVEENVTDNSLVNVTDNTLTIVTSEVLDTIELSSEFKYLVASGGTNFTYGEQTSDDYGDWASFFSGVSVIAPAYFVTGYKIRGQGIKKAQSNYVRMYNTGTGAFTFRARWDFTSQAFTKRWSNEQFVQFGKYGYDYQTRRLKIRGHGLAFQYEVRSFERNPFSIIGWASFDTSNERP